MGKKKSAKVSSLGKLSVDHKLTVLVELYKKHTEELRAIEASQEKWLGFVLGFLSIGITFLSSLGGVSLPMKVTAAVMAVLVCAFGIYFANGRNRARIIVRHLLVDVERALRLHEKNVFVLERPLYPDPAGYLKPSFLERSRWLFAIAAAVFTAAVVFFIPTKP
jgi:hypothetical protein